MISIIVPVFNAERTLARCIDSVMSQTYKDWELILVDDGSTDSSYEKCLSYICKENRIHVLHQRNSGAAAARNNGIKKASGQFLCFLDSDDYLIHDALEVLLSGMQDDIDLVYGGYNSVLISDGKIISCAKCVPLQDNGMPSDIPDCFFENGWMHSCCGKLYRQNIIKNNNLTFPTDMKLSEDSMFNISYIEHISAWRAVKQSVYNYCNVLNSNSITKSAFPDAFTWYLRLHDSLEHLLCSIYTSQRAEQVCVNTLYPQYYATIRKLCRNSSDDAIEALSTASNNPQICEVLKKAHKGLLEKIIVELFILKKWRAITWVLGSYRIYAQCRKK